LDRGAGASLIGGRYAERRFDNPRTDCIHANAEARGVKGSNTRKSDGAVLLAAYPAPPANTSHPAIEEPMLTIAASATAYGRSPRLVRFAAFN
jgi:hypothetical protein